MKKLSKGKAMSSINVKQTIINTSALYGKIIVNALVAFVTTCIVDIASTAQILCVNKVIIGKYKAIADATIICDNNNYPIDPEYRKAHRQTPHGSEMRKWKYSDNKPIIIGENVWIGSQVRINKGVTIGDNSIIAANSVVTKDVPANCIAAGNHANIVKENIDKIPLTPLAQESLLNFYNQKEGFKII